MILKDANKRKKKKCSNKIFLIQNPIDCKFLAIMLDNIKPFLLHFYISKKNFTSATTFSFVIVLAKVSENSFENLRSWTILTSTEWEEKVVNGFDLTTGSLGRSEPCWKRIASGYTLAYRKESKTYDTDTRRAVPLERLLSQTRPLLPALPSTVAAK